MSQQVRLTGRYRLVSSRLAESVVRNAVAAFTVPDRSVRKKGKNDLEIEAFKADANDSSQSRTP